LSFVLAAYIVLVVYPEQFRPLIELPSGGGKANPSVVKPEQPPPKPRLEVEELGECRVATGRSVSVPVVVHRRDFKGPVRITCTDSLLPHGVSVSCVTLAEGDDRTTVQLDAELKARPTAGQKRVEITLDALDSAGKVVASKTAKLLFSVLYLPEGFTNIGDETEEDSKEVRYYRKIKFIRDGADIPFVLVWQKPGAEPREGAPKLPTFYIMENKVSLGQFRRFAEKNPKLIKERKWERKGGADGLPVMEVTVSEAYTFAREWMKGNLPTKQQWDWAAGRYENPRTAEGPYEGKWSDDRKNIAVKLKAPMLLEDAKGDVSEPYGCKNMSGNGEEWTRTLLGGGFVPITDRKPEFDDGVVLRGCRYDAPRPLRYEDLKADPPAGKQYTETSEQIGFRVVIETP
jgi:formylglycine-generating enzyme required for sulfatase activity